jgi:hypothetical protein
MPQVSDAPKELNDLLETVYQSALKQYDGDKGKASQASWAAAKKVGWEKDKDGKWNKAKKQESGDGGDVGNILREDCYNAGRTLKVNRETTTIAGVKLLGTVSAKGREYPREVIKRAMPLYEGRAVNVDHVDPGTRRSYRDRIGCLRDVQLKEDGLYGTLHFNPKHVLAEQLIWDAENAPQNVGFSHDARGPSKLKGGRVVVESIDKVLSVDLVADPATTSGLFEDDFQEGPIADKMAGDQQRQECNKLHGSAMDLIRSALYDEKASPAAINKKIMSILKDWQNEIKMPSDESGGSDNDETKESRDMDYKEISLAELRKERPDLLTALQEDLAQGEAAKKSAADLKTLQEELSTLKAEKTARVLQETIDGELKAAKLDTANKTAVSELWLGQLREAKDADARKALIEDRVKLVAQAAGSRNVGPVTTAPGSGGGVAKDAVSFARSLRGAGLRGM